MSGHSHYRHPQRARSTTSQNLVTPVINLDAERELEKRLKIGSGECKLDLVNRTFEVNMPSANGWERFSIKIEKDKIVTGRGPYSFFDFGTEELHKFSLTTPLSAENFFVSKMTSLARFKGDTVEPTVASKLFRDVLAILEASPQLKPNEDMRRITLSYNVDPEKTNQPTSGGFLPTVSQRNYESTHSYGCFRSIKGIAFGLYDAGAGAALAKRSADHSAETLNQSFRKEVHKSQVTTLSGPVKIGDRAFDYHYLDGSGISEQEKQMLQNLPTGAILFFRHDDRKDATHIGIVNRGKDNGGIAHWGGSDPVIAHTIGETNIQEQIQFKNQDGHETAYVSGTWRIVGVLIPPKGSVKFTKGCPDLKEGFTDVVIPQGTTRLSTVAKWLCRNSPGLKGIPSQWVVNFLADINPDNIAHPTAVDAEISGPLRIPTHLLPSGMQNRSFAGNRSEKVCTLSLN